MVRRVAVIGGLVTLTGVGLFFAWQARDTTKYSEGFKQERFQKLAIGMKKEEVYALMGAPLGVREERELAEWCYDEKPMLERSPLGQYVLANAFAPSPCVRFDSAGRVVEKTGEGLAAAAIGMTETQVLGLLGEPKRRSAAREMTLHYTEPGGDGKFRARIVALDSDNRVSDVISYEFYD